MSARPVRLPAARTQFPSRHHPDIRNARRCRNVFVSVAFGHTDVCSLEGDKCVQQHTLSGGTISEFPSIHVAIFQKNQNRDVEQGAGQTDNFEFREDQMSFTIYRDQ